jgi:L-ascorbate metabolism protein UlaG (beta-lactamase superfamily)
MKLQLIRNATLKLSYGGRTILIDPYFAPRHSLESFAGISPNPLVDLPLSIPDILNSVDLIIVSHLHSDHYDSVAQQMLPKHLPLFCQPGDEGEIRSHGFRKVTPLTEPMEFEGIRITPCEGSHGLGPVVEDMGPVIGLKIEAADEPSIYWCGDTVLYPPVSDVISAFRPDVIVTHSCGARWNGDLIVMDDTETIAVCEALPSAIVIATHMEALDHATISRERLRTTADAASVSLKRLLIPEDGEIVEI